MAERRPFLIPSVNFPRSESLLGTQPSSTEDICDRIPPCIQANGLQQGALSRIVFSNKQVHSTKLREREVAEELETGNVEGLNHRQVKSIAFRW